jgi:two-component system nitrogen regulation response regulator GlnG
MLTRFFLQKSAKELGVEAKRITDAAVQRFTYFDFPGNVRQLENICHWLTVMAPAQMVEPKDLPPELLAPSAAGSAGGAVTMVGVDAVAPRGPATATASAVLEAAAPGSGQHLPPALPGSETSHGSVGAGSFSWLGDLEREARRRLEASEPDVWEALTRQFEGQLIHTALDITRGRRIEAAQKLGIGRNTITRKIQELGLDD